MVLPHAFLKARHHAITINTNIKFMKSLHFGGGRGRGHLRAPEVLHLVFAEAPLHEMLLKLFLSYNDINPATVFVGHTHMHAHKQAGQAGQAGHTGQAMMHAPADL